MNSMVEPLDSVSLRYESDSHARCPRWQEFLNTLFEDNPTGALILKRWFGLMLTDEISFQTLMHIVDPSRSGKDVIARVLQNLVGPNRILCISPDELLRAFGLNLLIDKAVVLVPGWHPSDRDPDFFTKVASIVGGDAQTIERKYQEPLGGVVLRSRFTLLSEREIPWRASYGRGIVLNLMQSAEGLNEESICGPILGDEMPGVQNWALEGLRDLKSTRSLWV